MKLRRILHCSIYEVDRQLLNAGLRPANSDYVRFIVLARSRTGSTMLMSAMNRHPQIVLTGEIFRSQGGWDPRFGLPWQPGAQLLDADPQEFAQKVIFRKHRAEVKAVGFKLFYGHAREGHKKQLWSYLAADKELRVIHLRRRNILKTYLSEMKAKQSSRWSDTDGNGQSAKTGATKQPIYLDFDDCLEVFSTTRANEQQFGAFFADHPTFNIEYETLVADYMEQMRSVQEFLDLDVELIQPRTRKQSKLPLSQQIQNYGELKTAFSQTEWAEFFVD